jgi:hypothetical protein
MDKDETRGVADDRWIAPRSIFEAKQIIAAYQAEVRDINGQLSTRKAQTATQKLPQEEFAAYLRWRASAQKAKGYKEDMITRLKLWIHQQGAAEYETKRDAAAVLNSLREARYYLHQIVEEGEVTSELMQRIVEYLRSPQPNVRLEGQVGGESRG